MLENLKAKLKAATRSWTAWLLALGLALTESFQLIADSLPLAQQAFDESTYQLIVRVVFIAAIVMRVRQVRATSAGAARD